MEKKKKWKILGIIFFTVISSVSLIVVLCNNQIKESLTNDSVYTNSEMSINDWESKHKMNKEFIGNIKFESNLINHEIVQTDNNEKYLGLSWDLQQESQGAIFMDYRNQLDDQNLILYGHYVYKDENAMFGPLHQLTNLENYEENKYIELELENEKRKYEVAYVYYYEMGNPLMEYYHTNYDEKYFEVYKSQMISNSFYDSQVSIESNDNILTLQTCVKNRDDLRLIVVAKQIDSGESESL